MTKNNSIIILREMLLDISYRLRICDDAFCRCGDLMMSAMTLSDFKMKFEALRGMRNYAQDVQLIALDLKHLMEVRRIVFPAELQDWIWDEENPEIAVTLYLERIHSAAESLSLAVRSELLKMELNQ